MHVLCLVSRLGVSVLWFTICLFYNKLNCIKRTMHTKTLTDLWGRCIIRTGGEKSLVSRYIEALGFFQSRNETAF